MFKHIVVFILIGTTLFFSCNYKAGNRKADLAFSIKSSVNSFYVQSYLHEIDHRIDRSDLPTNSELNNFPEDFFILVDSSNQCNYVIENNVIPDYKLIQSDGLWLSSIYDRRNSKWIYSRDSLRSGMLDSFKVYFEKNVLQPTVVTFIDSVNYDRLYIKPSKEPRVIEIN